MKLNETLKPFLRLIKMIKLFIIFMVTLTPELSFSNDCTTKGSRTMWKYDQVKHSVHLKLIKEANVCQFITQQKPFNMTINYLKGKEVLFTQKIYWPDYTNQEEVFKGKILSNKFKTNDYKVLKIPLGPKLFDSYEVYDLRDQLIGKGRLQ